jgi:hypothetical protein
MSMPWLSVLTQPPLPTQRDINSWGPLACMTTASLMHVAALPCFFTGASQSRVPSLEVWPGALPTSPRLLHPANTTSLLSHRSCGGAAYTWQQHWQ